MKETLIKLTKEIAVNEVAKIESSTFDNEVAHILEDDLHLHFIECVAAKMYTMEEAIELANIVKSTEDIDFTRWHA